MTRGTDCCTTCSITYATGGCSASGASGPNGVLIANGQGTALAYSLFSLPGTRQAVHRSGRRGCCRRAMIIAPQAIATMIWS